MTKYISKIAFLAIVAVSVGLMAWAVVVGASAPESDKIAKTMSLVGQTDENFDPVRDSLGKIYEVSTVKEGIEAMKKAVIHQMRHAEELGYTGILELVKGSDDALRSNLENGAENRKWNYYDAIVKDSIRQAYFEEIETVNAGLSEKNVAVAEAIKNIAPYDEKLGKIDARINEINTRTEEIDNAIKENEENLKRTDADLKAIPSREKDIDKKVAAFEKEIAGIDKKIAAIDEKLNSVDVDAKIEDALQQPDLNEAEMAKLQAERRKLRADKLELETEKMKIESEVNKNIAEKNTLPTEKERLTAEKEKLTAEKAKNKEKFDVEKKELAAEKKGLEKDRKSVVAERKPFAKVRKDAVDARAQFVKDNEKYLRANYLYNLYNSGVALYDLNVKRAERDSVWMQQIEGVTGSQFEDESKIVVDFLNDQVSVDNEELEILEAHYAANKEYFEAQAKIFTECCAAIGIEKKMKPSNPEDEKSAPIEDFKAMVDAYNQEMEIRTDSKNKKMTAEDKELNAMLNATCTAHVLEDVLLLDALQTGLATINLNIDQNTTNAGQIAKATTAAQEEGSHLVELAKVININLYWLYFLMVFAVVFVFVGFVLNLIQNPNWVKMGLTVVVVAAVCGLAYFIGMGHGWFDGNVLTVLDANGNSTNIAFGLGSLDSADRLVFEAKDYMLADVSIWITYLAFALAAFSAVFSWIWGIFKS